jgi:hypothetical protein
LTESPSVDDWRVAIRRAVDWAALAGVVAVVLRRSEPARNFAAWAWSRTGGWLIETLIDIKHTETATYSIDWVTVWLLVLVLTLYAISRKLWTGWDRREMTLSIALGKDTDSADFIGVVTGLWFQLIVAVGIWRSSFPSGWQFVLCLVPGLIFTVMNPALRDGSTAAKPGERQGPPVETIESEETLVGSLVSTAIALGMLAMLPFMVGVSGWSAIVWLSDHLFHGSLGGFRPATISSEAVGVVAVVVSALAWVILRFVRKRAPAVPPHGQI